jgi:hypothetical protein
MSLRDIRQALRRAGNARDARILKRFFKTGPGEYGEGDAFLGIRVPKIRALVRAVGDVPVATARALLRSRIHEERLFALLASSVRSSAATTRRATASTACTSPRPATSTTGT